MAAHAKSTVIPLNSVSPQLRASAEFYHERLALSGLTDDDMPTGSGPIDAPMRQFRIMNPMIPGGCITRYDRAENKYISAPKGKHDIFAASDEAYERWRLAPRKAIVEGPLKMLAFAKYFKRPAIGENGCRGYSKGGKLLPKIVNAIRPGDEVDLLIDGDIASNPDVTDAAVKLATALIGLGATVRIPQLPPDDGLDDWIQAQADKTPEALEAALAALPDLATADLAARIAEPPADANHYVIAAALLAKLTERYGATPVYTQGQLYVVENNLWTPLDQDTVALRVGEWLGHMRYCKKTGDFKAVAWLVMPMVRNDKFFDDAAIGIAGPVNFWFVDVDGEIRHEPLRPEHKARNRVKAEPDFDAAAPRFEALLKHCFGDDQSKHDTLQCLFGAALTQQLWRHRIVGLLLGLTTTGKSVLLNILRRMFAPEMVGATTPQRWQDEYYRAALAGKQLNIVGELDRNHPIQGGAFKEVVGTDLIEGRHPTHRPFHFVCQAAHFFNSNQLPPTTDRDDSFFKRWRIIKFSNRVAEKDESLDLLDVILRDEMGPVLAWMLKGAAAVARTGKIPKTTDHDELIAKWRHATNSALQFISDTDKCELGADKQIEGNRLYAEYLGWVKTIGMQAFGRTTFYETLEQSGGLLGVVRVEQDHRVVFTGVALVGVRH